MNLQRLRDNQWLFCVITLSSIVLLAGIAAFALQSVASGKANPGRLEQAPVTEPPINNIPFANHTVVQRPMSQWQPPLFATSRSGQLVAYDPQTDQAHLINSATASLMTTNGVGTLGNGSAGGEALGTASATDAPMDTQAPNSFSNLREVSDVLTYPWRTVVKLAVYHDELGSSAYYECSGALIDPYHVITSGECVFDRGSPNGGYGWATQIVMAPAYRDGNEPYGTAVALQMFTFDEWQQNGNFDWAVGYIRLDRPVGALSGWLGYGFTSLDDHYRNSTFQNAGYPALGSYTGERMYYWSGGFDTIFTHRVEHTRLLNDGGFGGSGAFVNDNNKRVEAIFTYIITSTNRSGYTRITQDKSTQIFNEVNGYLPTQVDLIPLDVNVTPVTLQPGQSFTNLNYFIENYSTQIWNGVVDVELYLSTDNSITTQDILLNTETTFANTGQVNSREGLLVTSNGPPRLPDNLAPGQYWIGILLKDPNTARTNNASNGWDAATVTIQAAPTPTPTRTPTPTTTPTVTPTEAATPTATAAPPTNTATATPTVGLETATATATATATFSDPPGGTDGAVKLFLPAIARVDVIPPVVTVTPTVTPIVTRVWQQIAGDNLTVAKVAIQGARLFVGVRGNDNDPTRGLYSGNIAACPSSVALDRITTVPTGSLLDVVFQGQNGAAVSYDHGVYHTENEGATWLKSTTAVRNPGTVTIVGNNYYLGTQIDGIYISPDQGSTWPSKITGDKLTDINILRFDNKTTNNVLLWIGTNNEGVFTLNTQTDRLAQYNDGLTGAAKEIWGFAFDALNIYIGTSDGVFFTSNNTAWQPVGVFSGETPRIASLIIQESDLIAGTRGAGIWRRPLNNSREWEKFWDTTLIVRDLLYDATHCNGLLAATDDGVWLYR